MAAVGDGTTVNTKTTTTTSLTTDGRPQSLRLQYSPGSFAHHPLSILPQPYGYFPIPLLAPTSPVSTGRSNGNPNQGQSDNKQPEEKTQTPQTPKKNSEPTTSPSPFEFRPKQRPRLPSEKLVQLPGTFAGSQRSLPLKSAKPVGFLLPPKQNLRVSKAPVYLPPYMSSSPNQLPHFTPTAAVDYKMVSQYQKPAYKFIIDKITQIPGELFGKILAKERLLKSHFSPKPEKVFIYRYGEPYYPPPPPPRFFSRPSQQYLPVQQEVKAPEMTTTTTTTTESPVMVEATNDLDANIMLANGEELIVLQPSARAVSGKDGTSIANPISRVVLRRNRPKPTTILYRPQAVAISGPGGTSHAQAELIIDYVDE